MEHIFEEFSSNKYIKETEYKNEHEKTSKITETIFKNIIEYSHEEYQYLNNIKNILDNGYWQQGRNGLTKSIFGCMMKFSLKDGKIPILTTKKVAWKTCLRELLWFIRGETDNTILNNQGVHIWDGNSTREYLDSRGLINYDINELGPIYGRQWRFFNKPYICKKQEQKNDVDNIFNLYCGESKTENINLENGIDQLQQIIDALKDPTQRTNRRLIMTAWNPCQLKQMALEPCHVFCQFNVHDGNKLSCAMYQRSNDEACGTSFNIASYSFLTHLLAKHCGLEAYEFIYFKGNSHIYEKHIEAIKTQLNRKPFPFPTISIKEIRENINDYQIEDFEIHNYQYHPYIKFEMVA